MAQRWVQFTTEKKKKKSDISTRKTTQELVLAVI